MIGTKKLPEIKSELREKFRLGKKDVQKWLAQKKAEVSGSDSQNRRVLEELMWVEKLLRGAVDEKKARANRATRPKSRKESLHEVDCMGGWSSEVTDEPRP